MDENEEITSEAVSEYFLRPVRAFASDGSLFSVEDHTVPVSLDELFGPDVYQVRGPIDRPGTAEHYWLGSNSEGIMADPDTPDEVTRLAEEALDDFFARQA